jgi:hypothetical protein
MANETDGYIQEQCAEVCEGVLLEDMVKTVERTKKMYCNVWIKDYFTKDSSHPLTYVPLWALSLPLRKDNKVKVAFTNGDINLPYLWKDPEDIDKNFYEKFEFEKDGDLPAVSNTVSVQKIGEDSYIVKTDKYTAIRQNGGFILMDTDNNVFVKGKKVQVISDKFSIVKEQTPSVSLFNIIKGMLDVLNNSLTTAGSPANHTVVPGQFQKQLTELQQLME